MTAAAPFDVEAVMAEVRAEVERRRAAGEYDEALLKAIHEEFSFDAAEPPEASAYIASVRPVNSTRPGIGPVIVFVKRVLRRLIAWYVAPIAEDQTRFNIASVRLARSLERRITVLDLMREGTDEASTASADAPGVGELQRRVEELERQVAALAATAGASQPASSSDTEKTGDPPAPA